MALIRRCVFLEIEKLENRGIEGLRDLVIPMADARHGIVSCRQTPEAILLSAVSKHPGWATNTKELEL